MEEEELIKKYNININQLIEEQKKLAKLIKTKDSQDFSNITKIAGIDNTFVKNQIISAIVVIDDSKEVIYQEYAQQKVRFPYLPEFRAYRELPAMLEAYNKLEEHPDLVIIPGHGITHPRLGIASHFSIAAENIPTIGLANSVIAGEIENEFLKKDNKIVGKLLQTKPGSRPLILSPGNNISLQTAEKIVTGLIVPPHKMPEPLRQASKFAKKVMRELNFTQKDKDEASQDFLEPQESLD